MRKGIILFLIALLAVFTGAGCSDDGGDGNGFVKFTIIAPDYDIPSLGVSLTSGFSGEFVVTNVSIEGVTNIITNTLPSCPMAYIGIDTGAFIGYAPSRDITAADLIGGNTPTNLDFPSLIIPLTNIGTTNRLSGMFSFSNIIYSRLQKSVDFSGVDVSKDNCSVTITSFGEVGGYITGRFNMVLIESTNKSMILTNGSFSFYRIDDDGKTFTSVLGDG